MNSWTGGSERNGNALKGEPQEDWEGSPSPGNLLRRRQFSLAELLLLVIPVAVGARFPALLPLLIGGAAWYFSWRCATPGSMGWTHRIVAPVAWGTTTYFSFHSPGDEYGLFGVGALPASWLLVFGSPGRLELALPYIIAAGMTSMGLAGWGLDALRFRFWLWLLGVAVISISLVTYALSMYPSYDRAMSKNGSFTAYVASALNIAYYLTTCLALALTPLARGIRWGWRRLRSAAPLSK